MRLEDLRWALVETQRRLANLIRLGVVHEADYAAARLKVRYDDTPDGEPAVTRWLPWFTLRAGKDRTWWAPEVGEQVVLLSPSGDLGQGVVLAGLYQSAYPANGSDADVSRIDWSNGSFVEHNRVTGAMRLKAPGGLAIEGDVGVTGAIESSGDVTGAGISLSTHRHGGVRAGGGVTGGPQ